MNTNTNSKPAMKFTRVFVYGSLKRGFHNHPFLRGQRLIGEARSQPVYRLISLGSYPGMIETAAENARSIHGEVWEVDGACKERLDQLEGVDYGHYTCVTAKLLPPFDQESVLTYLYARNPQGCADAGDCWKQPR